MSDHFETYGHRREFFYERKFFNAQACNLELKANADTRIIEGLAATFEKPEDADGIGDIFAPGAFKDTSKEDGPSGADSIAALWHHRGAEPFGLPLKVGEITRGLSTKTKASEFGRGPEALGFVREGVVKGMSVGFQTLAFEFLPEFRTRFGSPVRRITKAKLFEYSLTPIPLNPEARVKKSLEFRLEQFRAWQLGDADAVAEIAALEQKVLLSIADAIDAHLRQFHV